MSREKIHLHLNSTETNFTTKDSKALQGKRHKEGKTYESNIGMNLDQSVSEPARNGATNKLIAELNALIRKKIPRETLTVTLKKKQSPLSSQGQIAQVQNLTAT